MTNICVQYTERGGVAKFYGKIPLIYIVCADIYVDIYELYLIHIQRGRWQPPTNIHRVCRNIRRYTQLYIVHIQRGRWQNPTNIYRVCRYIRRYISVIYDTYIERWQHPGVHTCSIHTYIDIRQVRVNILDIFQLYIIHIYTYTHTYICIHIQIYTHTCISYIDIRYVRSDI